MAKAMTNSADSGIVHLAGALGVRRGLLAVLFYLALGIAGVPDFAEQRAGAEVIATVRDGRLILGSAGGYLLGFMLAAAASGRLAELGWDRKVGRALVTMTVGSLLIYLVGVPWLMAAEDLAVGEAIRLGLLPYLLGDLVKIVLAAAILPAAWWVVGRRPVAN